MSMLDLGRMVFVFGSNEAGRHGAGAARYARESRGAVPGCGVGHQGTSYALPTKDHYIRTLGLDKIREYVDGFIEYARNHPEFEFQVTRVGCGLAGLRDDQMAPMFSDVPKNCHLPAVWLAMLDPSFSRVAVVDPINRHQIADDMNIITTREEWARLGRQETDGVLFVPDANIDNYYETLNALAWGGSHYLSSSNGSFQKTMAESGLELYNPKIGYSTQGPSC